MLAKANRATNKDIEQIFKKGRFVNSGKLTLKFLITSTSGKARISVIAPKTVAKGAVMRNLLRRRGYAALAGHIRKLQNGFVGALIYGKGSAEIFGNPRKEALASPAMLEEEVKNILSKIK